MPKLTFRQLLVVLLLCISFGAYAQRETNYWYFGTRAGLWFSDASTTPVYRTDGRIKALEGCATISDSLGNLLFYTAGDTVFNRFHNRMNNGWPLTGHQSASQSSVIVEQPYTNLHYLFTVDALGGPNSLKYSVINAYANNLQGTVLAKNIAVPGTGPQFPISEKITAVDHRYSRDTWIIVHGSGNQNDKFYAYRLTSNGILPPVESAVGISHAGTYPNNKTIGYMKASPDGRKLALAMQELNLVEVYDFNDSSGVVSKPVRLTGLPRTYGVEFSRDGSKLYVSTQASTAQIEQFDLEFGKGDPDSVRLSRRVIGITKSIYSPAMQLAKNGRIYIANTDLPPGNRTLSVINVPDSAANKVNFSVNTQVLSASVNAPQRSSYGLPNFNQSYLWFPSFRARYKCVGSQTKFTLLTKRKIKSVFWNFGDGTILQPSTSTDLNPEHQYAVAGTYFISLVVTLPNNKTRTISMPITITPLPTVDLGPDQEICPNSELVLMAPPSKDKRVWSTGSTDSTITITTPGIYWLDVFNEDNCVARDSILIYPAQAPTDPRVRIVETCPYKPVVLWPAYQRDSYFWSNGSTAPNITVNRAGLYTVTYKYINCFITDSIQVVYKDCPAEFEVPNVVTPNGDDRNDKFQIAGFRPGKFSLRLYNRWGQLIFESDAYKNNWPLNDKPVSSGVYYYHLQNPDTKQVYKGWVEVLN